MGAPATSRHTPATALVARLVRAQRVARTIMDVPGSEIIRRIGVNCSLTAYLVTFELEVPANLAAEFRKRTLHRTSEREHHADIRKDRLEVATRLIPGIEELLLDPSWIAIKLVDRLKPDGSYDQVFDNQPAG